MSVELRPLGVTCNLQCRYCYQKPQRDAQIPVKQYDLEVMKAAILEEGGPFTVFGGEPLLIPLEDLDHLWGWGLEHFGHNSVQTHGALITDAHIELFRKYKVSVGISIDGPGEVNIVRWHGSVQKTRESTLKTEQAIYRLCAEGMPPSLIITLHRVNTTERALRSIRNWLKRLDRSGIRCVRLHLLESESDAIREQYALSEQQNIEVLQSFKVFEKKLRRMRFDIFTDVRNLQLGRDETMTCIFNGCDPYTTRAVRGVEGNGQRSNCGRTNKEGVGFLKSTTSGYERYLSLYQTPQANGGCAGCRFFAMCKGNCPGTAIDGDWRNRTEHCGVWMALFEDCERELQAEGKEPLSRSKSLPLVEDALISHWSRGRNVAIHQILEKLAPTIPGEAVN